MDINYIDIILDNSEQIDLILDFSDSLDLTVDISDVIDINLDYSTYNDFTLTDDIIDEDNLIKIKPVCVNCDDEVLSLNGEYGFLLYDDYTIVETKDKFYITFH